MKITDEPIYDPAPLHVRRQRMYDFMVDIGRRAYWVGIRLDQCPPFKIEDMAVCWKMGWRYAKEEDDKRKQNSERNK